jgi:hypothetical protein
MKGRLLISFDLNNDDERKLYEYLKSLNSGRRNYYIINNLLNNTNNDSIYISILDKLVSVLYLNVFKGGSSIDVNNLKDILEIFSRNVKIDVNRVDENKDNLKKEKRVLVETVERKSDNNIKVNENVRVDDSSNVGGDIMKSLFDKSFL